MPSFARRKWKTPQQATQERAAEKKAVKKYMADWDPLNLNWADYFLRRREECGESSIQVQYSLRVFERLGVVIEEDIAE